MALYLAGSLLRTPTYKLISNRVLHITAIQAAVPQGEDRRKWIDEGLEQVIRDQEQHCKSYSTKVLKETENWVKQYEIYYGKDRDLKNYPTLVQQEWCPKVRLGFIPDSWFQAFYPKTGVTGPYLFLGGLITFLFSKEIIVTEAEWQALIYYPLSIVLMVKLAGPFARKYLDNNFEKGSRYSHYRPLERYRSRAEKQLEIAKDNVNKLGAMTYAIEAKKENVDLQLEAIFRQRLVDLNQAVKRRMDYHIACENTRRQFQQKHMVEWIVDNVMKSINPSLEKDILNRCLADLKVLGTKATA